ncbi:hypothetical protein BT63DRAFT_425381 [Microthyrium microscopicum]|uniref:ATP-grasp domain-containing protein n=1 Tax=Microthyrium microscopicum TaxID=703497 RepID=A0A6A6UBS4_9PEZI|nr:hypothetical protein BT63DRAFT_425381 [Microthyrium microscopicum]
MIGPRLNQIRHWLKNISLLILSLGLLPLTTLICLASLIINRITPSTAEKRRNAARQKSPFQPKTILVTGVGMSKGLAIARSFYEAGHNVIGADFSSLACGRVSTSLSKYFTLRKPDAVRGSGAYIQDILRLVEAEDVDLWCSCSGVASAVEDGEVKEILEARTKCKAIQFNVTTTQLLHEKHSFIKHTQSIGLTVPETHEITSLDAVERALRQAPKDRKFIMKPTGMDDTHRGDMTLLPKATDKETKRHLETLSISAKCPWILQQYIKGPEYCTHALVINGAVKLFTSLPSAELLMHYAALQVDCKLDRALLEFTQKFAARAGSGFTGHLSFDFMVEEHQMDGEHSIREDADLILYPIECNPRAHTAVVLFNSTPEMAAAYLSILDAPNPTNDQNGHAENEGRVDLPIRPRLQDKYYWIGHDLVELVLQPLFAPLLLRPNNSFTDLARKLSLFFEHLVHWRDGTFERRDPLPLWWLYHVYWPMQFWMSLRTGQKWSRINVSTTKMFAC